MTELPLHPGSVRPQAGCPKPSQRSHARHRRLQARDLRLPHPVAAFVILSGTEYGFLDSSPNSTVRSCSSGPGTNGGRPGEKLAWKKRPTGGRCLPQLRPFQANPLRSESPQGGEGRIVNPGPSRHPLGRNERRKLSGEASEQISVQHARGERLKALLLRRRVEALGRQVADLVEEGTAQEVAVTWPAAPGFCTRGGLHVAPGP